MIKLFKKLFFKKKNNYRFKIFKSHGQWRFHFKAPNGEIMFSGESYKNKQGLLDSIKSIRKNVSIADVIEVQKN